MYLGDSFHGVFFSLFLYSSLSIDETPSQVIYTGNYQCPTLSSTWIPAIDAIATGNGDGVIQLYHVTSSRPSVTYTNGRMKSNSDGRNFMVNECNGPFDPTPKEAYCCYSVTIIAFLRSRNIRMQYGLCLITRQRQEKRIVCFFQLRLQACYSAVTWNEVRMSK